MVQEMDMRGIEAELGNGWQIALISTLTPGIVRIQLMSPGEHEPGWRKCVEAPTFDEALEKAIEFTQGITWQEYGRKVLEGYTSENVLKGR